MTRAGMTTPDERQAALNGNGARRSAAIVTDEREALRLAFESRPRTKEEADQIELDAALVAAGCTVDQDGNVTLPAPDPDLNGPLFRRGERFWFERLGLAGAVAVASTNRAGRARALAQRGLLTGEELAHLRWLATAENPHDLVVNEAPMTGEDARAALEAAGIEYQTPALPTPTPDTWGKVPKGTTYKARFLSEPGAEA
jgi:hypothetical protein